MGKASSVSYWPCDVDGKNGTSMSVAATSQMVGMGLGAHRVSMGDGDRATMHIVWAQFMDKNSMSLVKMCLYCIDCVVGCYVHVV